MKDKKFPRTFEELKDWAEEKRKTIDPEEMAELDEYAKKAAEELNGSKK